MSKFTRSHRYSLALIAGVATAAADGHSGADDESILSRLGKEGVRSLCNRTTTYRIGDVDGCLVTAKLAKDYPLLFCAIIGAILSYPLTRNILAVSGRPDWFVPACVIGIPLTVIAAWLLARLSSQGKVSTATQSTNE